MRTDDSQSALPIIQYWHDSETPSYLDDAFASFERFNPNSEHLIFDELTAAAFIEAHLSSREAAAFRSCAVPAMQSDYLRYCAVFVLGDVYADVDFHCKAPLGGLLDREGQLFKRPLGMVMNSFFGFRAPEHPFLRLVIDVVTANIESRERQNIAGVTGPTIFSGLAMLRQLGSIEAYLEVSKNGTDQWQPESMDKVAGRHERVVEAFRGLRIDPLEKLKGILTAQDVRHARRGKPWTKWDASIYR